MLKLLKKKIDPKVPTVFTTHATMLGRALAGSGADLYSMIKNIDPQKEAYNSGVQDKFLTEKACAYTSDTFTTVSEPTSMEAKAVFGKGADILVLNGLDIEKFPSWEELAIKHQQLRDHMREFCASYFFPYYKFDLSESLFYFIIGRYEFKNKGIDIFIKSLGRMNEMMKKENSNKTVISFFFVPAGVNGIKVEILENADEYEKMFDLIDRNLESIKTKIVLNLMHGNEINKKSLFSEEFLNDIKKLMIKFEAKGNPSLVTHNLFNENDDQIIRAFHENGLQNRQEDKVKVIFYPVYLDGADGLMDLKYYDAITAGHLGIFPSYYEPWGYTPLEANALGVPAVTTDLSGFGKFMEKKADLTKGGLFILKRQDRSDDQAVDDFTKGLHDYTRKKHKDRVMQKLRSKELSELADWKELISNYVEAHNRAIRKQED
jgi:glycogen(starch) synthase